jgi:hypothetical protein
MGEGISTPVLASQMVSSSDPETIVDPSGENATLLISTRFPSWHAKELSRLLRKVSMAFGSEMHSSFVSRDCLVNINEVLRVLKSAQEGAAEIAQITRLVSTFGSEMHSSFVSRDCLVNINAAGSPECSNRH